MKRVIIESPYAGDVDANVAYARRALADSLKRGEAPFASHLLYTQVLDDADAAERRSGMWAGWFWTARADLVAFYTDLGFSPGMMEGLIVAQRAGVSVDFRQIGVVE